MTSRIQNYFHVHLTGVVPGWCRYVQKEEASVENKEQAWYGFSKRIQDEVLRPDIINLVRGGRIIHRHWTGPPNTESWTWCDTPLSDSTVSVFHQAPQRPSNVRIRGLPYVDVYAATVLVLRGICLPRMQNSVNCCSCIASSDVVRDGKTRGQRQGYHI